MKSSLYSLFMLFLIVSNVYGQKSNTISIPLETRTDFQHGGNTGNFLKINKQFKGLPAELNNKNSRIKYYEIGLDTIYLVVGNFSEEKSICIIDTNKNNDFSDDYPYVYNKKSITCETDFPAQQIMYRIRKNDNIKNNYTFIKPYLFDNKSLTFTPESINTEFHTYYAVLFHTDYLIGEFRLENKPYKIALLSNKFICGSYNKYAMADSAAFDLRYLNSENKTYDFSIPSALDHYILQPLEISDDNTALSLKISDKRTMSKEEKTGHKVGFFLPRIQKKNITGKLFDSDQYKGKYILLDFWGSWCNPCIAMIPHIAEFHQKYKQLQIVSIAVEYSEKDFSKIPPLIQKHQMNWVNIVETFGINTLASTFMVNSFPTTILINPEGEIIFRGYLYEELKKKLEEELE